jgi:hypothetical protein
MTLSEMTISGIRDPLLRWCNSHPYWVRPEGDHGYLGKTDDTERSGDRPEATEEAVDHVAGVRYVAQELVQQISRGTNCRLEHLLELSAYAEAWSQTIRSNTLTLARFLSTKKKMRY